jgi:hypothetical protein
MSPQDALLSIAEISIGLAGFSGLVAAFIQPSGHSWRADQKTRIVLLIVLSFGIIVCALAPYALSGIGDSAALIWGVPMVAFSILCLGLLGYWVAIRHRRNFTLQFPWISTPIIFVAAVLQIVALLSGLGLIVPYSSTVFLFALLSVLAFGANLFMALLNSIWN